MLTLGLEMCNHNLSTSKQNVSSKSNSEQNWSSFTAASTTNTTNLSNLKYSFYLETVSRPYTDY